MADQKRITLYSGQVPQGSNIVDRTSGDRVTDIAANNNAQAFYFDKNKTQPVPAGFLKQNNFGIQLSPEDVYAGAINPINLVMNKTLQEYTKNRLNGYYDENGNVNLPDSNVSVYGYEQALKNPYLDDWFDTYMPDTKEQYLKYIVLHPNLASRTPYDTLDNIPMTGNIQSPHFINGYAQMGLEADTRKNTLINDAFMVTLPISVGLQDARLLKEGLNKFVDAIPQLSSDDHTTSINQHPEFTVNQTYGEDPMIGHSDAITSEQRDLINQAKNIYKRDQIRQLSKNDIPVLKFDTSKNPYIVDSIKSVNPELTNKVIGQKPFNSDDIYLKTQPTLDSLRVLVNDSTHGLRSYAIPLSEEEKVKLATNRMMHFQNKPMPFKEVNSRSTNMEKQFAEQAVPFSKESEIKQDLAAPLEEQALGTTEVEISNNEGKAFGGKLLNNNNLFNNGGNSTTEDHSYNTQNKEHQEVGLDNNEKYNRPPYNPIALMFEDLYTPQNVGLQGLMKSTLANQATLFNNPTAKRILGYDNRQYVFKPNEISEDGGEVGNVYLGSYEEYVSPGLQEGENPNLHYVPSENMWDNAHVNNTLKQSFKFRNPEEADYFAEHYKEVSPYSMTNNDEYSPIKKLFNNDEDNYSKGGSIRERAKEIRLKVAEKFKPIYDYLYNEDTEDNQYKRGGKVRRNTGESAFDRDVNTTLALDKYKKFNTPEWRAFLKSIAYQESSFKPNAKSIAGALGFYQLMPYENLSHLTEAQKKSGNWNQTALMLDHIEQVQKDIHNRLNYATLQKAKMMGLNDYDLLAIAHFSGVGGLRKWLRHSSPNNFKEGAKDGYGMSQFGYLKKFRKGMAKYSNNPEKETITPFPTESPTFDYEKYTEAILNQGLARLNAQYSQNYQDLPTYGPTKQSENPFEIKQLQDNFSSPFPLPNQLTQQPIQSAFGGIINRDNPIENYSNNPNIGLPTVRY